MSIKTSKKLPVNIRHIKNWILGIFGLAIILSAISFTLLRVAIKSVPDYTVAIQNIISRKMDILIEIGALDAEMDWLVPRLNLLDVKIFNNTGKTLLLKADELALSLDWVESIKTMTPVIGEIIISGVNIKIGVNKQSQVLIQNYVIKEDFSKQLKNVRGGDIPLLTEVSEKIKYIVNNLNVKILDSKVEFYDERHSHRNKIFKKFNLRLFNDGDEHIFEMKAELPEKYGKNMHLIFDVGGDLFDYRNLQGEMYLLVNKVHAAPWLDDYWDYFSLTASGEVNAEIWIDWDADEITRVLSQVSLADVSLNYLGRSVNTWKLDQLDARVKWEKHDTGWQLDIRDLKSVRDGVNRVKSSSATIEMNDDSRELHLQADYLRIGGLVYLVGMGKSFFNADVSWVDFLEKHHPTGVLKQLDVRLPVDRLEDIEVNTEFSQIGFVMPESEPSVVSNLQGSVAYVDDKTWLTLDSKNTRLEFNQLFRNSLDLNVLKGILEISHKNSVWKFSTGSLQIDTPHISTVSRARFNMPDNGQPFLDLTSHFRNGDGKYIGLYLPAGIMGKNTVKWLDNSIIKGHVENGSYQFYGYLNDVPFRKKQGVSLADFDVSGVDLSYLKNWPVIKGIDAHLRIENDSILFTGEKGRIFNSNIKQARVYIDNFVSPTLDIKGRINTQLPDLKAFVNKSSLNELVTDYINNIDLSGKGMLDLELFIPLYGDYRVEWGGKLVISDGGMIFKKEKYELTDIQGSIRFAGDTVESSGLKARIGDKSVDIDVKTSQQQTGVSYDIGLRGKFSVASLLAPAPSIQEYFKGDANWDIMFNILPSNADRKTEIKINMTSDFQGVTSVLPGRLGKLPEDVIPLNMKINIQPGRYVNYEMNLNEQTQLGLIDENNQWLISVNDKSAKGKIIVNRSDEIEVPVKLKFEYLDLNKFFEKARDAEGEETDESATEILMQQSVQDENSVVSISPRDIPSLDLVAKSLVWKKFNFTGAVLKTQQSKLGMIINKLNLISNDYSISAKGNWLSGWNNKNTTKFEANVVIGNLGRVFKQLELSDNISGASGHAQFNWHWQGAPYEFDWSKLQGDGRLSLKEGTIKQLNAGAGRVLGFLNFETLLSLDFGNQVSDGFSFDKVNSTFSFSRGNVYTDDFKMESKVADISMTGYMDIKNGLVDQKVTVQPHLDSTLSLGTAVIAGPTVGGLVYLFQKLFNTSSLSEYEYSLKGKVEAPKVEVLSVPRLEEDTDDDF